MKHRFLLASLVVSISVHLMAAGSAQACTCMPPDVATSFESSTDVAIMKIKGHRERGHSLWYAATVLRVAKGCTAREETVLLQTPSSSAACGLTNLRRGRSYLINGDHSGELHGRDVLAVSLCDYNVPVRELTRRDIHYLRRNAEDCQPITCDDLAGEDFGMCEMVLGYGVVDGICQAISGCGLPDDVVLAETMDECIDICEP